MNKVAEFEDKYGETQTIHKTLNPSYPHMHWIAS